MKRLLLAMILAWIGVTELLAQDANLSRQERNTIRAVSDDIARLERLLRQRRYEQAVRSYHEANEKFAQAPADMSDALRSELEKLRDRLTEFQQALSQAGVEVPAPNPLPQAGGDAISFARQIAPLLVDKCGRCHVSATRGRFSMATYNALLASRHVEPGQPAASRLIQVIETGDMPRGGGSVAAEELELLRQWVSQGARSDLDNNNQNLNEVVRAAMPSTEEQAELTAERPTGTETISFALDVAPVFLESCVGCHGEAQQVRGGLNMTTFAGLLRGGDSGLSMTPGRGAESLLIRKLRGMAEGQRMPLGRPALPTDVIDKIAKWIDEGARYDGGDPALPIRTVAARVRANSMKHEQLAAERAKAAEKNWNLVVSDRSPNSASGDDVLLMGSVDARQLGELAKVADGLMRGIKSHFKLNQSDPLVKGKVTILVFDQRYDFNEYGLMILGHPLPREIKMAWRFDQVDAQLAWYWGGGSVDEEMRLELTRHLAALYAASVAGDMPRWFAEGIGYEAAAKLFPRSDTAKSWLPAAQDAAQRVRGDDLLRGRLAESQAGLVGYAFVARLKNDASRFQRFWASLQRSGNFAESFQATYQSTLEQLLGSGR